MVFKIFWKKLQKSNLNAFKTIILLTLEIDKCFIEILWRKFEAYQGILKIIFGFTNILKKKINKFLFMAAIFLVLEARKIVENYNVSRMCKYISKIFFGL